MIIFIIAAVAFFAGFLFCIIVSKNRTIVIDLSGSYGKKEGGEGVNLKEIKDLGLDLCYEIEELQPSDQQTKVISLFCEYKEKVEQHIKDLTLLGMIEEKNNDRTD